MLKAVLGLLSGPLSSISKDLKEAYQSKLAAQNDAERIKADEKIAILEARKASILAAQSDRIERWVRILYAAPCIIYLWKLIIWDKVLELGVTDDLSGNLWTIFFIILGGYFVDTIVKTVVRR